MVFLSSSPKNTQRFASLFATKLKRRPITKKTATVLGLQGTLGSGKTTFIQGFARELGIKKRIASPTFVLFKFYPIPPKSKSFFKTLIHIDAYRFQNLKELRVLTFQELLRNPKHLIVIEWADTIKKALPKETFWIRFAHTNASQKRKISLSQK